jgi:glycosyltransferase involved in cell wall biosynthesis
MDPVRLLNVALYRAIRPVGRLRIAFETEKILATMAWVENAVPASKTLISVVLCSRDRVHLLPGAVASVQRQRHVDWELIVVDDGSNDATASYLGSLDDPRIQVIRTTGVGPSAARNLAIAAAQGDCIAYLDDDNRMHEGWLKSVAWALETFEPNLVFGARVVEAGEHVHGMSSSTMPQIHFPNFSRRRQRYVNSIDLGALAHRAGLPGAYFDPDSKGLEDWGLVMRLTAGADPLPLPSIACMYATSGERRSTYTPERDESSQRFSERFRYVRHAESAMRAC